ncbi:MAG TPA: hypothetical protein DEQ09_13395 [Bacteroidales bacterium]|nr:hypothetical protein [Bacteroidales bacterium]
MLTVRTIIVLLILAVLASCSSRIATRDSQGRKKIVSGQVTNTSGGPVEGAIMFIDGKQTSYNTNSNGYYMMRVKGSTETISVFELNNGSEQVYYADQDTINFVLAGSFNAPLTISQMGKEYVDVGYGKVQKDNLTTSVGVVRKQKLDQTYYTDIYSMIQGEVPGVTVSGTRIIIRGIHTVNASTDPLFVVDGVRVSSISHINPINVESINILKGASASIYGVNGANGVILINTKKADRKKK